MGNSRRREETFQQQRRKRDMHWRGVLSTEPGQRRDDLLASAQLAGNVALRVSNMRHLSPGAVERAEQDEHDRLRAERDARGPGDAAIGADAARQEEAFWADLFPAAGAATLDTPEQNG